jgi:phage tail sheath protein FI
MQTSVSIFDIIGGNAPNPVSFMNDINTFRANIGSTGLDYGAAYYPFVGTDIMQNSDIDYTNLFGGDITQLAAIINPPTNPDPAVTAIIADIQNPASGFSIAQNNTALLAASETYTLIMQTVLGNTNILPPSGAIAGVITNTDNEAGPWQSPANVSVADAISLPIQLTDAQNGPLNVDPVTGKSINTIRSFNGLGILVWGARTLDGNDQDWRYIPVRRAIIFIEQSCKLALQAFVFQPNDAATWSAVISSISSFLTNLWKQGALMGASANESFTVACGVPTTMTAEDILNGIVKVSISVAVIHPAEFIDISLQQQMATN